MTILPQDGPIEWYDTSPSTQIPCRNIYAEPVRMDPYGNNDIPVSNRMNVYSMMLQELIRNVDICDRINKY